MEHTPPPLFRTGPTPLARLMIFSMLSLVLLIADARFNYITVLRQVTAVIVYPLQRLAAAPATIGGHIADFFVTHGALRNDNRELTQKNLELAREAQQTRALQLENAHLRGLLAARERITVPAGTFDCLVVQPVIQGEGLFQFEGDLTIWLSDDEHRLPVIMKTKVKVGAIDASLKSYRLGRPLHPEVRP